MRRSYILFVAACLLALSGCGGGGNNGGQVRTTPVKFDISWAERSRAVNAPASALSATLTLKGARPDHGDFNFSADRKDDPAAYTQTYTSTNLAVIGTWNATVTFYANKSEQGPVVGIASKSITLKADGSGLGDIVTVGTVASVQVTPGQTVVAGRSVDLLFTALDSAGNLLAVTPGSAKWNVSGGTNVLQVSAGGTATGLQAGTAKVTVTVDGKTSASADVNVIDNVLPGLIAEATATAGTPSVRLRWASGLFSGVAVQQIKLYRLPDFPFGSAGAIGTLPTGVPVGTAAPALLEFTDLPTPNFFYKAGGGVLTGSNSGGLNGGGGVNNNGGSNGGGGGGGTNNGGSGGGTLGSPDCVTMTPSNLPTLDVGFLPGQTYRYQLTAVGTTVSVGSLTCIETDPVQSGQATPIAPVMLTLPANQASSIDLRAFAPTFTSRAGADLFQLEVSTDPTFKNPARIYRTQIISTSPNSDGVSQSLPQALNLTTRPELLADTAFANFVSHAANAAAPTIYWRVGARHDQDVPGPVHFISQDPLDPDRTFRFVYSAAFSFIPRGL